MEIHNFPQYSPEWWAIRAKRMTASNAQPIGANGKGLVTYIRKMMREFYSTDEKTAYSNKSMQRGLDLEDSAGMVYAFESGLTVEKVGFVTVGKHTGCSPDLFVEGNGLAEIKCLEDAAYFDYMMDRKIDSGYMWQMQMQMQLCERDWCDYVVYNPNFKTDSIISRVFPDPIQFDKLNKGYEAGIALMAEIERKSAELGLV